MGEVRRQVACVAFRHPSVLFDAEVNCGFREVSKAAGVVRICVSKEDISYVARAEAEPFDLPHGRIGFVESEPRDVDQRLPDAFDRRGDVSQPMPVSTSASALPLWSRRQWHDARGRGGAWRTPQVM